MIAELVKETKIRVVDETWSPSIVNNVPSKFLEKFETPELASASSASDHVRHDGHVAAKAVKKAMQNPP